MKNNKIWLITGATSQIAQEFARLAAQAGCNLLLLGRNADELSLIAGDLQLRYPIKCGVFVVNFSQDMTQVFDEIFHENQLVSLFIAHSCLLDNQALTPEQINTLIQTNITSTIQLIHAYFAKPQEFHELIFLSSVAAARGRAKNSLYGASKTTVEVYLEGLQQHAPATTQITIARLGYIDTVQTYGLPGIFYASPPTACAKACWQACEQRKRFIYHPFFWCYIIGVIKRLPFYIYQRLSF